MDAAIPQVQRTSTSLWYPLFLIALFFMLQGPSGDPTALHNLQHTIERRSAQADRFRDWLHGNGTSAPGYNDTLPVNGSEVDVVPSWNATFHLPVLREASVHPLLHQIRAPVPGSAYFRNVTGFLKGSWSNLNVSLPSPIAEIKPDQWANMTETEQSQYNHTLPDAQRGFFPWTATMDEPLAIEWNLRETEIKEDIQDVSFVRGGAEFKSGERTVEVDIDGVHYLANGSFFLIGVPPDRLFDIRHLPALMPDAISTNRTAHVVYQEMQNRIAKMKDIAESGSVPTSGSSTAEDSSMNCTFYIYGQLAPLRGVTADQVAEYEEELRRPSGARVRHLPPPKMEVLFHSPNCQLVLKVDEAEGLHMDRFWQKTVHYAVALSLVGLVQTLVLIRQMQRTSSPSAIARLAYLTIASQGGMDSYSFVTHLTLGALVDERASLSLFIPAFFASLSGLLFGLRYAASIRVATIDMPTAAVAPPSATAAATTATIAGSNETPAAPATPPVPFLQRPDLAWYAFCTFILAILLSVLVYGYIGTLTALLFSFWLPQIWKNAERGSARRTLSKEYIVCTTLCRLFLPLYVWGCPSNVLFTQSSDWVWVLVAYQLLQMTLLLLQESIGPRCFIPAFLDYFPEHKTWDYFPKTLPVDLESGGTEQLSCVICMEAIHLPGEKEQEPDEDAEEGERDGLLEKGRRASMADIGRSVTGRWSYMVPPCHHIMHTQCLESWLAIKSECPTCRRPLPLP